MKTLQELLDRTVGIALEGSAQTAVTDLNIDSRRIQTSHLYAAMPGTQVDGHAFCRQAALSGASAILVQQDWEGKSAFAAEFPNVAILSSSEVSESLGQLALNFFDRAAESLVVVGVTGTNGKTSVCTLLFDLFTRLGFDCGLVSTVENRIKQEVLKSTHTTPNVVDLHRLFAQMLNQGCTHCFMEVSSHAAHQNRIAGVPFAGGVFTNITHDHLDYHGRFDAYIKAKKSFFDRLPATAFALTNRDDRNGMVMLQNTKAMRYTFAMNSTADFRVKILEHDLGGMLLHVQGQELWTPLVGGFNASNLLAVYAAAFLLTEGEEDILPALSALPRVNGRFEALQGPNNISAIVDYAHTPDALLNVIQTINEIRKRGVNLITVVGCGGDRDREKRPEMARIAVEGSDRAVFTADNPRSENAQDIINEMAAGVPPQHYKKMLQVLDRKEAIKTALLLAQPGDVVLVAGKGHETYQEINGVRHDFDDKAVLRELFELLF
jgi:UDP-N-acetylmuramoyl-L-alanyl-D-glutamate--2,6-diaminopimelate ligase